MVWRKRNNFTKTLLVLQTFLRENRIDQITNAHPFAVDNVLNFPLLLLNHLIRYGLCIILIIDLYKIRFRLIAHVMML